LDCLCDVLLPIPLDERAVLDALTPPPEALPTIETTVFQVFSALWGAPVACRLHLDEETILAEFSARWPEQAGSFRDRLQERTAQQRAQFAEARAQLEQRLAAAALDEVEENAVPFSAVADAGVDYNPVAEFLYAEIARQRHDQRGLEEFARQLGEE